MIDISAETLLHSIDPLRVPKHVAVIMDGNGRWAKARGQERSEGHVAGVEAVRRIVEAASVAGVEYLTLYAFSTENWHRPQAEVDALMHLMSYALERETPELKEKGVRLHIIGDMSRMPKEPLESLNKSVEATSQGTRLQLNLALSYSSRWEITNAVREIAGRVKSGEIDPESITDSDFASYLTTAGIPDPDLLIRTGGDKRISNYLLWQIAYSELYFTTTLWPDFDAEGLYKAIIEYQSRERRFGKTSEQIQSNNHI